MSGYVLDASAAIAMVMLDERTAADEALHGSLKDRGAAVTGLWHLEVANVLLMAERRKRITTRERLAALSELENAPIVVDTETVRRAWRETFAIAATHSLTVYDASYLELTVRLGLPLVTRDRDLIHAAGALGLRVC